jgi:N-acetylglucosamine-6-phosphate deacetylase
VTTIRGGRLVDGEEVTISIVDGQISDAADDDIFDADGLIVAPGLIDIQINGGFGHDFTQDPSTIWEVGRRLPELGITSFVPTVVTSPPDVTDLALDVVANRKPDDYRGADVLGLHFEGPWIAPVMHGAHNPDHITDPDPETASRWAESGLVRIVTLAPERPGASHVIQILTEGGVRVSVGHSAADYLTTQAAYHNGASLATHLFNQMTPLGHREPGVVGAALLTAGHCLLIVDGLHISEPSLEIAWRILGDRRTILVTDAMAALGLGPGVFPLGDGPITVGVDGPRTIDGRLAGSVVTLPEAIGNLAQATTASVSQALRCATANPAEALGLGDRGDLRPGSRGDVVILDDEFRVMATFVAGDRLRG